MQNFLLFLIYVAVFALVLLYIYHDVAHESIGDTIFAGLIIIMITGGITYIIDKFLTRKKIKNLPKLFFSPLLGLKFYDERINVDFNLLIKNLDYYNSFLSELLDFYDSYDNRDRNEIRMKEIELENEMEKRKKKTSLNPINMINPLSLTEYTINELNNSFAEISKNIKQDLYTLNRKNYSQKYMYMEQIAREIKEYKYVYLLTQFLLRETLQIANMSDNIDSFLSNLRKNDNPLSRLLLYIYNEEGKQGMVASIKIINKYMYGIYNVSSLKNARSFLLLREQLLVRKDSLDDLNIDLFTLIEMKKHTIMKKIKKIDKKYLYLDYLYIYFGNDSFAIEMEDKKEFVILKINKDLQNIYNNSSSVHSFINNLLANLTQHKIKKKYKKRIMDEIKNNFSYLLIDLENFDIKRNGYDKLLKDLLNNNYSKFSKNVLKRKELIADYLQILDKINDKILEEERESIYISENISKNRDIIKFIEDKIFIAIDKINTEKVKNDEFIDVIKSELYTSENEFIEEKYGKELEQIVSLKF